MYCAISVQNVEQQRFNFQSVYEFVGKNTGKNSYSTKRNISFMVSHFCTVISMKLHCSQQIIMQKFVHFIISNGNQIPLNSNCDNSHEEIFPLYFPAFFGARE